MRELEKFGRINTSLRKLEGDKRPAIVASGQPNMCSVLRMLDEYAQGIPVWPDLRLLDLANKGTLRLTTLAHDIVSWHIKVEELIFTAHDIGNKGSAAYQGERVISDLVTGYRSYTTSN